MGTFILKKNEQMVQGFPVNRSYTKSETDAKIAAVGGGTEVTGEVVAGSGTSFTLANSPIAGTVKLYAYGQRLKLTDDYSISGAGITMVNSWGAGTILADYKY